MESIPPLSTGTLMNKLETNVQIPHFSPGQSDHAGGPSQFRLSTDETVAPPVQSDHPPALNPPPPVPNPRASPVPNPRASPVPNHPPSTVLSPPASAVSNPPVYGSFHSPDLYYRGYGGIDSQPAFEPILSGSGIAHPVPFPDGHPLYKLLPGGHRLFHLHRIPSLDGFDSIIRSGWCPLQGDETGVDQIRRLVNFHQGSLTQESKALADKMLNHLSMHRNKGGRLIFLGLLFLLGSLIVSVTTTLVAGESDHEYEAYFGLMIAGPILLVVSIVFFIWACCKYRIWSKGEKECREEEKNAMMNVRGSIVD